MHSQVQGLKSGRFRARVKLAHPYRDLVRAVEVDVDELAEATGVVVPERLGVAKRLEDRVRLEDALFDAV